MSAERKKYIVEFFSAACQWEYEDEFFMKKQAEASIQKSVDGGYEPTWWRIIVIIPHSVKPRKK